MKLLEKKGDGSAVVEFTFEDIGELNLALVAALLLSVHSKKMHPAVKKVSEAWTETVIKG